MKNTIIKTSKDVKKVVDSKVEADKNLSNEIQEMFGRTSRKFLFHERWGRNGYEYSR